MPYTPNSEVIDKFEEFYSDYYHDEISELAQKYPNEQRSLYLDWGELYRFDPDLADDFVAQPDQMRDYAEEALRLYDLPVDVKLGQAHIRILNLQETTSITGLSARHRGQLVGVDGIVQTATDVQPRITEAAFECQRCGTLTRIPQTVGEMYEPSECQGCERQGPFNINFDQSEFVDDQTIRLLDDPKTPPSGRVPDRIDVHLEDDITGEVSAGDRVRITGVVHLDQEEKDGQKTPVFEQYMNGLSIVPLEQRSSSSQQQPPAVTDLDSYTNLAATALSTLPENVREEETKAKLITPFIEALGWNKFENSEVRLEYSDSKTSRVPDYALFGPDADTPDIIVEAKQLGTDLKLKEQQLNDYLRIFSTEWGVLTNGEEFHVYRQRDDGLPEKLAEVGLDDVSNANILDSLRRSAFYGQ